MKQHARTGALALSATVLALALITPAHAQGMMGGGMMGPGMMGGMMRGGAAATGPAPGASPAWDQLSAYVQRNRLPCLACHGYSGGGSAPPFAQVAQRFAARAAKREELAAAIANGVSGQWPGYPPMPGGLATPAQARELAGLILRLASR